MNPRNAPGALVTEQTTDPISTLKDFVSRIDTPNPRLVVRWTDETRIAPHGESGYTVAPTAYAILTAKIDGQAVQQRVDAISLDTIKRVMRAYPIQVLYRADNLTR